MVLQWHHCKNNLLEHLFLRVFGEPKMVLSRRHYENTILDFLFLQVRRCEMFFSEPSLPIKHHF